MTHTGFFDNYGGNRRHSITYLAFPGKKRNQHSLTVTAFQTSIRSNHTFVKRPEPHRNFHSLTFNDARKSINYHSLSFISFLRISIKNALTFPARPPKPPTANPNARVISFRWG